jgi:hypothetical protein
MNLTVELTVEFTQEQYDRYKAGFKKLQNLSEDATDEQLIAQLKREASAITYAAEIKTGDGSGWAF